VAKLPWYSFLYRLLGVHGTFWLWLLAVLAVWWTAEPAVLRFANPHPTAATVSAAARPAALTRWVAVEGLSVAFDRRLLLREGEPGSEPLRFLLDPADPAASWWGRTRDLCDAARAGSAGGAAGGALGLLPAWAQGELEERFTELGREPQAVLPVPERALLVLAPGGPSLGSSPADVAAPDPGEGFERSFYARTERQIDLVRERVRPRDRFVGVLHETPPVAARRIGEDLNIVPAPSLLIAGRKPRELERIVFGVALVVLVLLIAGLFGARRAGQGAGPPAPEAPA